MSQFESLTLDGMAPETLYQHLTTSGLSSVDAGILVGSWIYHNFGGGQRTFAYGAPFEASDPNCTPTFARSFHHADWVDGESVVQAQPSTGEDGFNTRFHNIEADVDALSAEIARVFACVADMRAALHDRLAELGTELNRIDADVFNCCQNTGPGTPAAGRRDVRQLGRQPGISRHVQARRQPCDHVAVGAGRHGAAGRPAAGRRSGLRPARAERRGFSKFVADHPEVAKAFAGKQVSVADFVSQFGAQVLPDGTTVAEVMAGLPQSAIFPTVDDVDNALSEQAAGTLRAHAGVPDLLAASLGTNAGASFGSASIDQLTSLPADTRAALVAAGLTTIDAVATADPAKLSAVLGAAKITATAGDIAAIRTTVKTVRMIR